MFCVLSDNKIISILLVYLQKKYSLYNTRFIYINSIHNTQYDDDASSTAKRKEMIEESMEEFANIIKCYIIYVLRNISMFEASDLRSVKLAHRPNILPTPTINL